MRKIGRALAALFAVGFAACGLSCISRCRTCAPLRTRNPETTAFIELRLREARAKGLEPPRRVQRLGELRAASPRT